MPRFRTREKVGSRAIAFIRPMGNGEEGQIWLDTRGDRNGDGAWAIWIRNNTTAGCVRKGKRAFGNAEVLVEAFETPKEESLVFHDWPADGATILVPVEGRSTYRPICRVFIVKNVCGVQRAVPEESESVSMDPVRPRLENGVDHATGGHSILCAV